MAFGCKLEPSIVERVVVLIGVHLTVSFTGVKTEKDGATFRGPGRGELRGAEWTGSETGQT